MDEETPLKEYNRSRQLIEEQEDDLKSIQKKGERLLEDTLEELHYVLRDISIDDEAFNQAKWEMEQENAQFEEQILQEKKALQKKEEEAETTYRSKLKEL